MPELAGADLGEGCRPNGVSEAGAQLHRRLVPEVSGARTGAANTGVRILHARVRCQRARIPVS
jgi:hypothetical protein